MAFFDSPRPLFRQYLGNVYKSMTFIVGVLFPLSISSRLINLYYIDRHWRVLQLFGGEQISKLCLPESSLSKYM